MPDLHRTGEMHGTADAGTLLRPCERHVLGRAQRRRSAVPAGRGAGASEYAGRDTEAIRAAVPQRLLVPVSAADLSHAPCKAWRGRRSEEHTSELQSLMRISYAVYCLKKKNINQTTKSTHSL